MTTPRNVSLTTRPRFGRAGWLALTLLVALAASAQDVMLQTAPAALDQIVTVPLSAADRAAVGLTGVAAQPVAAVRGEAGWQALPTQYDAGRGDEAARLTVALPAAVSGHETGVWFTTAGAPAPAAPPTTGLQVTREGDAVRVETPHFAVVHDPTQGGLPHRLELLPSGKVFEGFDWNDRVYEKTVGGYYLRYDRAPQVEVVAAGPLVAVVRVAAHYCKADGQRPPSEPAAVYEFRYQADSPVVTVSMTMTQTQPVIWPELHGLELNFADESFPGFVAGNPLLEREFTADKTGANHQWAALRDGDSLVGLFGAGTVKTYDGRGQYGTYVHGPWLEWGSLTRTLAANLYLSGAADGVARLAQTVADWRRPEAGWLMPVASQQTIAGLTAGLANRPPPVAGRLRWWLGMATAEFRQQRLAAGVARLRAIADEGAKLAEPGAMDRWFAGQTGWECLFTDRLALALDGATVVSLYDQQAQRELLAAPSGLWQLKFRDAAGQYFDFGPELWPSPLPDSARLATRRWTSDGIETLELTCSGLPLAGAPGPVVRATCSVSGGRLNLALSVDNPTELSLWEIECPRVRIGVLGEQGADDVFFFPKGSGEIQRDPAGTGVNWGGLYPGGWSTMQYLAVYDPAGGLYLAAEDPVASDKETFGRGPDGARGNLYGVRWPAPDMSRPGNDWTLPGRATLALFDGDWYDAARLYRDWAAREAQWWPARARTRPTPDEIREIPFWVLASGAATEPNNVVEKTIATAKYMGVPTALHWYNWSQIPFDDDYPHYNPAREDTPQGVRDLQAAGVRVMPYINGRLWDVELDDFKETAHQYATKKENGEVYIEIYGSKVPLAPMCPATEFWQKEQQEIVRWLTQDIGVDGVYLDQIGAAKPVLCFDASHGHPLGGGHWWTTAGYWPMLDTMREALPEGKFLTTECNAEPYMQYLDGYLTWHWQEENQVPAFSAVYADQVVLFSRAYRGGPTPDLADRMKAAQQLVFGEQIGWISPGIENRPAAEFMKQCVTLRLALKDYLAHGEMRRPPALPDDLPTITADWRWRDEWLVTLPQVQAGTWQAADGRVVVLVANPGPTEVSTTLTLRASELGPAGRPHAVTRWTAAGSAPAAVPDLTQPWAVTIPAETVVAYELLPGEAD